MCGIIGAVGVPKNPVASYSLLTNLLRETQRRGRHATGFYMVDLEEKVVFDKEPEEARDYVKSIKWKQLIRGSQAIIGHCRFATSGNKKNNINNHPFISSDNNIGFVHNGVIYLYDKNKKDYEKELISECDSELVLRMITKESDIISGIKKVYEELGPGGDFACELIHRQDDGSIKYYFFRDDGRPGKLIDAREEMGQYFICSETAIWKDAIKKTGCQRKVRELSVQDIEPFQIFCIDSSTLEIEKIEVEKPIKIQTCRSSYSSYYRGSGYCGSSYSGNSYYNNRWSKNDNYDYRDDYYKNQNTDSSDETVLDENWYETTNEDGYPMFIYDPDGHPDKHPLAKKYPNTDNKDSDDIENIQYVEILKRGLDDPHSRWVGWEDDALEYGVIDEDEYDEIIKEKIESHEDEDNIQDVIFDQSDDDFINGLSDEFLEKQNDIMADEPPDPIEQ